MKTFNHPAKLKVLSPTKSTIQHGNGFQTRFKWKKI